MTVLDIRDLGVSFATDAISPLESARLSETPCIWFTISRTERSIVLSAALIDCNSFRFPRLISCLKSRTMRRWENSSSFSRGRTNITTVAPPARATIIIPATRPMIPPASHLAAVFSGTSIRTPISPATAPPGRAITAVRIMNRWLMDSAFCWLCPTPPTCVSTSPVSSLSSSNSAPLISLATSSRSVPGPPVV